MRELLSRTLSEGGEPRWHVGRRMALYRHPKSGTPVRSRDYAELLYMVRGRSMRSLKWYTTSHTGQSVTQALGVRFA